MQIKILKEHKSIRQAYEFELPIFTILTGENGSGKSHLFEAISTNKTGQVFLDGKQISNIRYLPFNTLNPQVDQKCDPTTISQRVKEIWQHLENAKQQVSNQRNRQGNQPQEITEIQNDPVLHQIHDQRQKESILRIAKRTKTLPSKLTEDDISDNINNMDLSGNNLFNSQFALIFKAYHIHYLDNKMNQVLIDEGVEDVPPCLSKEDFEEKFGEAPWVFVNSVLERLKLPYSVNNPMKTKRDSTFDFKLVHNDEGFEINTNDLSTGEKTLMSLALAIYNTTNQGDRAEMLILDEPDAPLHPSMSKLMLEILEEDIAKKHNIPVLISTHSPTTIACAPAKSLYKITRIDKTPKQCDLEDSMSILSYGIPNLNVSTENRRQVFVEHAYDVAYYEALFEIVSRKDKFDTLPQFLPPHTLNGCNCDAVLDITRKMRDMGNRMVYGLIDWDGKNNPESQVIILGSSSRYSIENYLFEPHLAGLYLVKKNFLTPAEIGLSGCHSYLDVCETVKNDFSQLQVISDSIALKLFPQETSIDESDSSDTSFQEIAQKESKLINNTVLNLRIEFFEMQGHSLEEKYKSTWPQLMKIRSNNGGDSELKKDIINTVINDFPDLLSVDILKTFQEIK